ncbi:alginate lyase family protein [Dyadobacter psychrophilus]|uniref:Heparinase II/III N-terminus n=1 Tax=Dyadobacter psychrophilus TaxID=651661 RepID=A0A1T5H554_9BACT|nr:alginate lyase family protein [Dyadobacter psychrophilus]SKC15721.1 Heparinase II/III N-terminus [Dyadobacter psychrophilus]
MIRFLSNMGVRYLCFRLWYEIQGRIGLLRLRFSVGNKRFQHVSKEAWLDKHIPFPFDPAKSGLLRNAELPGLQERAEHIRENRFLYFNDQWKTVPDWHTNPENGFTYDKNIHWSKIPTLSRNDGDIKYVWEKSRFCFLSALFRFDFHFEKDQSELVFALINDWIDQNPVNRGPNWRCGQEISLRVINWLFALHYYKHSESLSPAIFTKIIQSIYDQMRRVAANIHFSRTAVRNNHALTETLTLYIVGTYFPHFPESRLWKSKAKRWFEQEIAYQIYEDGTFLQFSMNYHRIAVQLLTLAITVAELNADKWADVVYDRARKSLYFLRSCQDDVTGFLPNYGNNDGALFFPLSECPYHDFRPQLEALSKALQINLDFGIGPWNEEALWLSLQKSVQNVQETFKPKVLAGFENGGYYTIRDDKTLTFVRCGAYKDRPFQADNLHLDIWVNGMNLMRDAGSYSYNTDEKWTRYFAGTASHNSVMLGEFDQMKKGPRFIWFNWIKKAKCSVYEHANSFEIDAEFEGFNQLGRGITHHRRITKTKGKLHWTIEDHIENLPDNLPMHQIWHPHPQFFEHYQMTATDKDSQEIKFNKTTGWYSDTYGKKVAARRLVFSSFGNYIRTVIEKVD